MRTSAERLTVLVVDDHEVALWGFKRLLESQPWVGTVVTARSCEEALDGARAVQPDVAVIDLFLGGEELGVELCRQVVGASPRTRVLLISGAGRIAEGMAKAAGAAGFVSKDWSAVEIASAVRVVARGGRVFAHSENLSLPNLGLTARERDVLRLVAQGATNREVAGRLYLSPQTVKEYVQRIARKLRARNRTDLVARAQRLGLVD